jgi:hypothetical protein
MPYILKMHRHHTLKSYFRIPVQWRCLKVRLRVIIDRLLSVKCLRGNINDVFLQRLRNSTKTSVTMNDLSTEIYTHNVQITKQERKS